MFNYKPFKNIYTIGLIPNLLKNISEAEEMIKRI